MNENPEIPVISEAGHPVAERSPFRRSMLVSLALHSVVVAGLCLGYLPMVILPARPGITLRASQSRTQPVASIAVSEPEHPDSLSLLSAAAPLEAAIRAEVDRVAGKSDAEKLSELERNLQRLEKISSPESVDTITTTIAGTLGLEPGATSQEDATGTFDLDSAQLHDVLRKPDPDGGWAYESVLVDAAGRTVKVPMSAADGEPAYQAFEQMRRFPMAAGIYRQIVMPMMQKMLQAEDLLDQANAEAERLNQLQLQQQPNHEQVQPK